MLTGFSESAWTVSGQWNWPTSTQSFTILSISPERFPPITCGKTRSLTAVIKACWLNAKVSRHQGKKNNLHLTCFPCRGLTKCIPGLLWRINEQLNSNRALINTNVETCVWKLAVVKGMRYSSYLISWFFFFGYMWGDTLCDWVGGGNLQQLGPKNMSVWEEVKRGTNSTQVETNMFESILARTGPSRVVWTKVQMCNADDQWKREAEMCLRVELTFCFKLFATIRAGKQWI